MKFRKKPLIIVFVVFIVLATTQVATTLYGHRLILNLSGSEPMGMYRLEPLKRSPERGELVLMDAPENAKSYIYGRGWLPEGWPLLKTVGAIPGDSYCITDRGLSVNGKYIGPVFEYDSQGLPLPRPRGCGQVAADHFLPVATRTADSFDGRYFGAVSNSAIRALAEQVFIFQE